MTADKHEQKGQTAENGRLRALPTQPAGTAPLGLQSLGIASDRDGFLWVPPSYKASQPAPLVLLLHGAGGSARQTIALFQPIARVAGLILLAPASRRQTWDIIYSGFGADIAFIDSALQQTFSRYAVDPKHVAIAGFSDGASYALSVGLTNGDLFTHIIAFSPGFMAPGAPKGSPRLFVSHGTKDAVLPVNACSRKIVPKLQGAGYNVVYREFEGGHAIPPQIALSALSWFSQDYRRGISLGAKFISFLLNPRRS